MWNGLALLRETSNGARLPIASSYAELRPRECQEPHRSGSEETDSGVLKGHAAMDGSPLYRREEVERAYEVWIMSGRPYSSNLREFPFLNRLFDLELVVFNAVAEW